MLAACTALFALAGCGKEAQTACAAPAAAAPAAAPALTADEQTLVAQIHTASDKYKDVKAAEADGYMRDPANMCVTAEMVGAPKELGSMGVHYFRPDLLGVTSPNPPISGTDGVIDAAKPEVLVYEPEADGSLQLVATEYLVFQDAWKKAGHDEPPALAGQKFKAMADDPATPMDEAHGFTPHYELHVWTGRDNPNGMFAEFNPKVSCPPAAPMAAPAAPAAPAKK
jgi:hypothetical protein